MVSTVAGSEELGVADGVQMLAQFTNPSRVCLDANGDYIVRDGHGLRRVTPQGSVSLMHACYE